MKTLFSTVNNYTTTNHAFKHSHSPLNNEKKPPKTNATEMRITSQSSNEINKLWPINSKFVSAQGNRRAPGKYQFLCAVFYLHIWIDISGTSVTLIYKKIGPLRNFNRLFSRQCVREKNDHRGTYWAVLSQKKKKCNETKKKNNKNVGVRARITIYTELR